MTIDDLAHYLQVPKSSLYKLAQGGRVPGHKVGKHWRFHKEAIDRWLTSTDAAAPTITVVPTDGRARVRRGGAA